MHCVGEIVLADFDFVEAGTVSRWPLGFPVIGRRKVDVLPVRQATRGACPLSPSTAGITLDSNGLRSINKEYRGTRLFIRLGSISQDDAEKRLRSEIHRVDLDVERMANARPLFKDCATRYLFESRKKRSAEVIAWHVRLLISHLGELEPHKVHDATLEPFIDARLARS